MTQAENISGSVRRNAQFGLFSANTMSPLVTYWQSELARCSPTTTRILHSCSILELICTPDVATNLGSAAGHHSLNPCSACQTGLSPRPIAPAFAARHEQHFSLTSVASRFLLSQCFHFETNTVGAKKVWQRSTPANGARRCVWVHLISLIACKRSFNGFDRVNEKMGQHVSKVLSPLA